MGGFRPAYVDHRTRLKHSEREQLTLLPTELRGFKIVEPQGMTDVLEISDAASNAASAVRGIDVPSLGKIQRGDFTFGGVGGGGTRCAT